MNTKQSLSLIAVIALSILPASAQIARPMPPVGEVSYASTGIAVNGHGELKVKPDVAFVSLQVITTDRDQGNAVKTNAAKAQAVIDTLNRSNIMPKDIHTNYYTVQPVYDYNSNPPVLTGYTVTNAMDITIHDISKAGLILDKATRAGATSADGLTFDLADKNKTNGEALIAAVANARTKADLIAGAAGVSVGRLLSITEAGADTSTPGPRPMMMMAKAQSANETTTPVSPDLIDITADVTATYSIDYSTR